MFGIRYKLISALLVWFFVSFDSVAQSVSDDDILDLLPAILSNVERRPPPPPPPAQWRILNRVSCPSNVSEWIVTDGVNTLESNTRGIFAGDPTEFVSVEAGVVTFNWTLDTEFPFVSTCGIFRNSFNVTLTPGVKYEFTLFPSDSGGLRVSTRVVSRP